MAIKISGSTIIDDSRNIVNAGVTTVGVLTGTDARFSGTIEANEYLGSGTKFTGIVTSIVAGANISVDQSTGQVTVTGLANTSNVISDTINTGSLNVTGLSTFAGLVDINAGGQANTFKVEDLTDNRVVIAGTGGELEDDSNLTFNGSTLSVGVALDVDGQTDLDVLNVAELATFTDNIVANGNIVGDNSTNISGISSVTSTTYYGDGSNLTSIISGVGVQTSGGYIGAGVTTLDFRGSGITTVTDPSSGFSTVFVNGTAAMSRTVGLVTAGVGQSAFTVPSYDLGNNSLDVYLNGIKLEPTEYTETNGTTITLASGAKVGDILQAFSYDVSGGNYWKLENNVLYRSNTYAPVAIGTDLQNGSSVLTVGHPGLAGTTMFVYGGARVTGVLTAASFSGNADTATALQTPRTIALTGDVVATATPFDGTSNISIAATIQPNSVGLGTDTFGDYVESISGTANEITVTGSGSETAAVTVSLPDDVTIGDSLTVTNDATVGGALTVANVVVTSTIAGPAEFIIDPAAVGDNTGLVRIKGDLRVDGEEFIVQSTTVELADHVVGVATTCASNNLLDGGGISIGAESIKKTFLFNNSTSSLESSIGLAVTSGGAFKVGSGTVLNSTTLGSGIVNSSLTSLGTLSAVTVSGDVSIADKIVHTGDTNTAIRFPSTDTVTVETAGSERMRITSAGNVGIGTDSPSELLHLESGWTKQILKSTNLNTASSLVFDVTNVNTADFLLGQINGKWNGTDVAYINFEAGADTTNKDDGVITLLTSSSGGSPAERMRINYNGEVGIKNTNPENYGSDGRNLVIGNSNTNDGTGITLVSGSGGYSTIYFADGNAGVALYKGTITYSHTTENMDFWTNSVRRVRIDTNGRLGIGADSPESDLHVKSATTGASRIRIQCNGSSSDGDEYASILFEGGSYSGAKIASHRDDGTWDDRGDLRFYSGYGNDVFTERLRITNTGKIGVAVSPAAWSTAASSAVVQIAASVLFDYSSAQFDVGHNYYFDGSNYKWMTTGYAERMTFSKSDGSIRFWSFGTGSADATATPLEKMRITSDGEVGIATASPVVNLDVNGALFMRPTTDSPTSINGLLIRLRSDVSKVQFQGLQYTPSVVYYDVDHYFLRHIFHVNGSEGMRLNSGKELLIGYTSDNGAYKLQVNSQIFATSATVATSDGNYKENVSSLTDCLNIVDTLNPVSFTWKEQQDVVDSNDPEKVLRPKHNFPTGKQVGFIAQEVQTALDGKDYLGSIIKENSRQAVVDDDGNEITPKEDFLGIAEGNLTALLVGAIKELKAENVALKARLDNAGL